jgi:hypothetical protein
MPRFLGSLFPRIKSEAKHKQDLKYIQRGIVARRSRGNVNLQQGKYMTAEDKRDLDKRVIGE